MQSSEVSHKVIQFQVEKWSGEGLCHDPQVLVDVIKQLNDIQQKAGTYKTIVVHGR